MTKYKNLRFLVLILFYLLGGHLPSVQIQAQGAEKNFSDTFVVEKNDWTSTGKNPYFILEPGYFLVLEGNEEGKHVTLTITVLDETKEVAGVQTRVVEEKEESNGKPLEISRNYFAMSKKTNSVYYFGEDSDTYKDGKVSNHDGSWLAGVNNFKFGTVMPGKCEVGACFYQELAPGTAMDRAEIISLTEKLETLAGKFENCLKTEETSALEEDKEYKIYAPGIGLIKDESLKLTRYGFLKDQAQQK
jgi:hypothetical protein